MTLTLDFQGQIFNSHILGVGRSINLEWKKCELDAMLDTQWANWACSWATVHGKYIGQVTVDVKLLRVSNLLAHGWAVHSLI